MALSRLLRMMEEGREAKILSSTLRDLRTTDEGMQALKDLRKNYDLIKLKSGDNYYASLKATDENISKLTAEAADHQATADTLDTFAGHYMQGDVPGGSSPIINTFRESSAISGITFPKQMLNNWQKVNKTADIIEAKLTPKTLDLNPSNTSWAKKKIHGGIWHVFSNPKLAFKELSEDLVTNPTFLQDVSHKYGKHARDVWKRLTKDLSKEEREALDGILGEGNDAEEVFIPVSNGLKRSNGTVINASQNLQEAYYGTRMLLDHLYWMNNEAARGQAIARGFKSLDGELVRVTKARHGETLPVYRSRGAVEGEVQFLKVNPEMVEEGYKVVEKETSKGVSRLLLDPGKTLDDIPQGHAMIGYRTGYVPVIYTDGMAISRIAKLADGTYRSARVSTAPTRVKAQKAVERLTKEGTLADDELQAHYIYTRKNDTTTDIGYGTDLSNVFNNLSKSEVEGLKKALVELGLDADIVDSVENSARFFSHKRNSYMMQRGSRLKDWTGADNAPIVPSSAAIQKYMESSASYAAQAEYVGKLESRYLDEFGELLSDPRDVRAPLKRGRSAVASNGRTGSEASLVRGQIDRIAGRASTYDRAIEDWVISSLDSISKTRAGAAMNVVLDKLSEVWGIGRLIGTPSVSRGVARIKGFTATAKLGMFNISQAFVQGTASLNVIGKNPIVAMQATKDMMKAVAPEIIRIGKTKEGRRLFNQLDDSGFIAGFNYVELQRVAAKQTDTIFGSRALRKLWDLNIAPYQLGEGGVRTLAWLTERRILLKEMEQGLHTKMVEGNQLFLKTINDRASITALNMGRVNQPLLTRGILGVPLQFKQFLVQQAEFMFNPKNFKNSSEMARVWAAWTATFGIAGVPFMFDLGLLLDSGWMGTQKALEALGIDTGSPAFLGRSRKYAKDLLADMSKMIAKRAGSTHEERNELREMLQRIATEGVFSAATEGDLNIANRAALARVFTEYSGHSQIDDLIFGPGYQTMAMLIENNVENVHDFIGMMRSGDNLSKDYILSTAARSTRGLPGIQHPLEAADALLTGQWRDTERRLVRAEPSLQQILYLGAGFGGGKRAQQFERMEFSRRQAEAWKGWLKGRVERIARLSETGNTKYSRVLFDDTVDQIAQSNPALIKDFSVAYGHEMLRRSLDETGREILFRMQDVNTYYSDFDRFQFGRDALMDWKDD